MKPRFFRSPADFRRWLEKHAHGAQELWLGYYKRGSGEPSVTWPGSVDHALCFGWIDGVRKSIDPTRYMIRFTPRKPGSTWRVVNIRRVEALRKQGLMQANGLAAFGARRENRSCIYSYEQRLTELPDPYAAMLNKRPQASSFFAAQPQSNGKAAIWWVVSAKQETTRLRRLEQLINDSECERRLKQYLARKTSTQSPALTADTPARR